MLVENGCSSVTASVRKLFRSDQRPASALPAPRAGLLAITAHRGFSRANGASESVPRRVLNCRFRASPLSLRQFDTNGGKRRPTRRAAPPFALPAPRRPPCGRLSSRAVSTERGQRANLKSERPPPCATPRHRDGGPLWPPPRPGHADSSSPSESSPRMVPVTAVSDSRCVSQVGRPRHLEAPVQIVVPLAAMVGAS